MESAQEQGQPRLEYTVDSRLLKVAKLDFCVIRCGMLVMAALHAIQ